MQTLPYFIIVISTLFLKKIYTAWYLTYHAVAVHWDSRQVIHLSLNRINYAYITIITNWEFNDNACMARACSSEKARRAGWLLKYQGAFISDLRLLSAVLAEVRVLVVVVAWNLIGSGTKMGFCGNHATIKQLDCAEVCELVVWQLQ